MDIKPMLACEVELSLVKFPCYVIPKVDGVRCLIFNGEAYSRTLKKFPNKQLQHISKDLVNGDYELYIGSDRDGNTFNRSVSYAMSIDTVISKDDLNLLYIDDYNRTCGYSTEDKYVVNNYDELIKAEDKYVSLGYEGIIIRYPNTKYKHGRSTINEGCLMKYKRFKDSEASIISVNELISKEGINKNTAGSITVADINSGVRFNIGTGLNSKTRKYIWDNDMISRIVRYKYQDIGKSGVPRFPVFTGFRSSDDI